MNLRQRTLLSVGATLVCLIAGMYFLSSEILLQDAERLDQSQTNRSLDQIKDELTSQIGELHSNSAALASWETAEQVVAASGARTISTQSPFDGDTIVYLDAGGAVRFAKCLRNAEAKQPPSAEEVRSALCLRGSFPQTELSGLLSSDTGLLAVSVHPILAGSTKGRPQGWVAVARRIDGSVAESLARRAHVRLSLLSLDSNLPDDCRQVLARLESGTRKATRPLDGRTIGGYMLLRDVFGRPVRLLRSTSFRASYVEALDSRSYLVEFIVAAGLIFSIVILWLIEYAALSRVSRLSRQVEQVVRDPWDRARVELSGRDELSWLARQVDTMVQGLRQSKEELRTKNRSLEQANRKLAASNHTLANTVEGISEVDHLESLVNYNAAFAEMHGYTWQEMEGLSWRALIVAEDHGRVTDTIERMEDSGKCRCEVKGRRKDGSTFYEEIVMVAALGAGESRRGGHWFTRDISERKELEAQIEFRAFHDTLTGLPNRALFVERLREVCQRGAETGEDVAVLFLDLDDFKDVNDSMGHDAGDHMLSGVAARLQSLVRRGDTVARLGGDEFTVLLRDVESVNEAVEVAERILAGFKTPIELPSAKLFARASIGIAHSGQSERSPEALLHDADVAMYYAKEKTKQCYAVFSPEMNAEEAERRQLAEDLRSAIESDLLSLHYQPMIDFRTGKAVAVEAFLRWHDSLRGEIPPELLISVADEAGLMDGIWHWTLRRACRQMRSWLEVLHDDSIVMNVNVSAKEIGHPDLVNTIATALSETGLAPAKLRIEVSAKSLATEKERAIDRLRDLKGLGVALALDDFGTGSHLISRLGEYPFDVVKIDSSLTWRLDSEPEVRAIAASIVLMAEAVQVEVVGEGIETLSQLGELQELGCAFGQGYLFGKPMPPEDLLPKLVNGVFTPIHADSGVSELAA